jgi:hypothetical protein
MKENGPYSSLGEELRNLVKDFFPDWDENEDEMLRIYREESVRAEEKEHV